MRGRHASWAWLCRTWPRVYFRTMNTQGPVLNPYGPSGPPATYLLRGPHILEPDGSFGPPVDLQIERGVITAVGTLPLRDDIPDVDATGLWLMPGMFDCHA